MNFAKESKILYNILYSRSKSHKLCVKSVTLDHICSTDEAVAKQLVGILHGCETQHQGIEDPCAMALEVAKCFRTKMHELNWAPSMEVAIEEIMTAV